ncbi:hypothetical protein O1M63_37150 [Streptomyces mirabilis]|nr:hypothetical protein [Streptomyces mirabilis]
MSARLPDRAAPCGAPNTFRVTYRIDPPLDKAAIAAFSPLACHLVKDCSGGCDCRVASNQNLNWLSRQGVALIRPAPSEGAESRRGRAADRRP